MSYQSNTSNNKEITEEVASSGFTSNINEIIEEGGVASSSTAIGTNISYEDDVTLFVAYDGEWKYDNKEWFFENSKTSIMVVPKRITLSEIINILNKQLEVNSEIYHLILEVHYRTGSPWFPVTKIQNDKDLSVFISETSKTRLPLCVSRTLVWDAKAEVDEERRKDCVTLSVAYDGVWVKDDDGGWFFKNSESSIIYVPKCIRLSEITDILYQHLDVDKKLYRLGLGAHPETGSSFHTQIKNNEHLSLFISETSKTKLPLCVIRIIDEQETVTIFVAYKGKWECNGEEWFFKNSKGLTLDVHKHITLSEITGVLNDEFDVNEDLCRLRLEVHYRTGSPWFPIIEIRNDQDLSRFILETSKTKVPLCVKLEKVPDADEITRLENNDDTTENRLLKAIQRDGWVKAREIVNNTEGVTWTSTLDDAGCTAFHYAVGALKDNEVVRDIVNALQSNPELLETTVNNDGQIPAHVAASYGNTEALKIMMNLNPKCLFIVDKDRDNVAINWTLGIPSKETFQYLFKQMQSYKDEFDRFLRGKSALKLLGQVIDTGLIDVADKLIKDYPRCATQVYLGITPLESIIRKPDLFYSGTHYNFYKRFVYRYVPIKNKSFGSTKTDEENQETPKKDKFVAKQARRWLYDVISRIWVKLWETTLYHIPHVKQLKDDKVKHNTTLKLLRRICEECDRIHTSRDIDSLYSYPFFLAVENNTVEAIYVLSTYFATLQYTEKDGQDIYQLTVLNRSEKVYSYILHHLGHARTNFSVFQDNDGNNILHLAGHLAPIQKLNAASGAALQMQQELQWFEEVKKVVPLAHTRELNKNKETPMMVFRKEHKELRKDGEEWMKKTADSYTITAALIITIVFAAAITVPGGNDSATGKPIYETQASLIIFAISDAISLFTSTTSLLLFLSILTARYADEDFLYKLPKRLIFGLAMLFVSVTSMMVAFGATLYIMFGQEKQWILIPVGALACLPIASFVTLQFPLLQELISSTYGHGMFDKENDYRQSIGNTIKKKRA